MSRAMPSRGHQQGAATLVVVMVLFLVMALLAAYANRNLLFEQRMASSYFRGSLSQEVAEAGVEWTLAQLNGTALNTACAPAATGGARFADRYLSVNPATRAISPLNDTQILADCTRDSAGWTCRCPAPGTRVKPAAVVSSMPTPSFGVQLSGKLNSPGAPATRPGTLRLLVNGCSSSVIDDCLPTQANQNARLQQATNRLTVTLGLISAVRSPPAAPLVVRGAVSSSGAGLGLHNTDARSAGVLMVAGGAATGLIDTRMDSLPGTALSDALQTSDATLGNAALPAGSVFRMFMGMTPTQYRTHPALRMVSCAGDCAATLADAYAAGQRMVWVDGPMELSSNQTLGSATDPMVVIANGAVTLTGPLQLNGMLVALGNLGWINNSGMPSLVQGMVLVEGQVNTNGTVDIVYQQAIADQLRNRLGSYVRVPGGWIDE